MSNKNVLLKLVEARNLFAEKLPKKTGHNSDKNYDFFQLEDIVPIKNEIFRKLNLIDLVTFNKESAVLQLTDLDSEESIVFSSPMPVNMRTLHPNEMQGIGSAETYQRRYLYLTLLDIVEADPLDTDNGKEVQPSNKVENTAKPSVATQPIKVEKAPNNVESINSPKPQQQPPQQPPENDDLPMVELSEEDIDNLPNPEITEVETLPNENTVNLNDDTAVETEIPSAPAKENVVANPQNTNNKYSSDAPVEDLMNSIVNDEEFLINYRMPFGKYKGQRMYDLSYSLCKWYVENYTGKDNVLKAVANLMMEVKKAA